MTPQRSEADIAGNDEDARTARAIADLVAQTERASGMVLVGIMTVCIGTPSLLGIARGHPFLGMANALLLGLVGWGMVLLIHAAVLNLVSVFRYSRAANRLDRRLQSKEEPAALHRSWSDGAPGAITVAEGGRVWLADRSTRYRPIVLDRADIRSAEAVSCFRVQPSRGPRAALGIGLPMGGGLIATIARTPRPKAATVTVSHALVMTYAVRDDAAIHSTTIPFGSDLAGAKRMAVVIRDSCPTACRRE